MNHTAAIPAVVVRRTYPVPRERLYEAWTTPDIAAKFLGGGDHVCDIKKMDVRTGGTYEFLMKTTEYGDIEVVGTYTEVIPNVKLVMTWRWKEDDPKDEFDTHLTLEFNDVAGGSEVLLTHYGFASQQSRDNHESGWTDIVDEAKKYVK
jgi:uncharacterized protein YndB with AHSA1/START domain